MAKEMIKKMICIYLLFILVSLIGGDVVRAEEEFGMESVEDAVVNFLFQSENITNYKEKVLDNGFGPSNNQSSGVYKKKEDTIYIYVDENTDQLSMPTYTIAPLPLDNYTEVDKIKGTLKKGENIISSNEEGIIHFQNESEVTNQAGIKVSIQGGVRLPRFILDEMTDEEWEKELLKYPDAPGFELIGKTTLITGGTTHIQSIGSPTTLLNNMDKTVASHDKTSGLDDSSDLHRKPRGLIQHLREANNNMHMYAWYYHTGYSTKSGMKEMLQDQGEGWGAFHEFGHTYQVDRMNFGGLTEVTTNIYSLRAQKIFGQSSRLEKENTYEKAFQHMEDGNSYNDINDLWVKLVMFWQLELAFGEDFYPQLHKLYREEALELRTDEQKLQYFIVSTSKVANTNLIPFFEKWGLNVSLDTQNKLVDLTKLKYPIWTLRDTSAPEEGLLFNYTFKGMADNSFATMNLSLNENTACIETMPTQPNSDFHETYASITIQDNRGLEKYKKEYIGTNFYDAEQEQVSLEMGDFITVYHTEFQNRLVIENTATGKLLDKKEQVTYQVTDKGLKLVDTASIPEPEPGYGFLFKYTFKDSDNNDFTTMLVDIANGELTIDTPTNDKPDGKTYGIYTAIQVHDQIGKEKYEKVYLGTQAFQAAFDRRSISLGDYITVFQKDYTTKLEILNVTSNQFLKTDDPVSYQVTNAGLQLVDTFIIPSYKYPKNPHLIIGSIRP